MCSEISGAQPYAKPSCEGGQEPAADHPDLFDLAPSPPTADERRYALAALANAADNVKTAPEGARNVTLNLEAYSLARFVQGGTLSHQEIEEGLGAAAAEAGLTAHEIASTLKSAWC